jgi:hypothetical protein
MFFFQFNRGNLGEEYKEAKFFEASSYVVDKSKVFVREFLNKNENLVQSFLV